MPLSPKVVPFLWFDGAAEEAARFYCSLFAGGRILEVTHLGDDASPVLTVTFELDGQRLIALNGGPQFRFTEAFSLLVSCDSQAEVDRLWSALTDGGHAQPCGWLKDRFGLSWQIIPRILMDLLRDPDPARAHRVLQVMMSQQKIDIAALEAAHRGN